jgi:RimJ/RimL family protein N-acetyltransferase
MGESLARRATMLDGARVRLRPVREADLDGMYDEHIRIATRGRFYPLGIVSEPAFRKDFAETGFWQKTGGTLLLVTPDDEIAGHIEFFRPDPYWDAWELAYHLYDDRHAGHGYTTEAVQLLVDYLFASRTEHRIQLVIEPGNGASIRIAEKCGFTCEGTARGAFFVHGANHDMLVYSLLRGDPRPGAGPA